MVNIDSHRVIDMIESRDLDDVVKWLQTYPNIQIVSRDGSITYRNAITEAHPNAIQVSDRFHLLKNLTSYATSYLKKVLNQRIMIDTGIIIDNKLDNSKANENRKLTIEEKYHKILILLGEGKSKSHICKELNMNLKTYDRLMLMSTEDRSKLFKTKLMNKHEEKVMQKMKIVSEVREMKRTGLSISEINRQTGISRVTISKYLDKDYSPIHASYGSKRHGKLIPYLSEVHSYLEMGVMGTIIEERIREKGYEGSSSTIRHYITDWKRRRKQDYDKTSEAKKDIIERKDIFKLLFHPLEKVKSISVEQFHKICEDYPEFESIHKIVWKFKRLLIVKNLESLNHWLRDASILNVPEINSFVNGIHRDFEAVKNAILLTYSNGLAEGSVNKLKVIKRIMYGRCGFEMLKTKTLRLEKMRKIN